MHRRLDVALLLAVAHRTAADSIQRAGLTTGMPEGYGRTPGLYAAAVLDAGLRTTSAETTAEERAQGEEIREDVDATTPTARRHVVQVLVIVVQGVRNVRGQIGHKGKG